LSSDRLYVSWRGGPGRAERFRVLLTDPDRVLWKNISVPNTETSAELDGLRPGTLYAVTVETEAVGLTSRASKQAVTGRYYGMTGQVEAPSLVFVLRIVPRSVSAYSLCSNDSSP